MAKSIKLTNERYWSDTSVVHGQDTLKATIDGIITGLNDTGWIKVTSFQAGAGHFDETNNPVCYRKIGKVVYLCGSLKTGSANAIQFILPTGFRPKGIYNCWIVRSGTSTRRFFINYWNENGYVFLEDDGSAGIECRLEPISFIASD